MTDSLIQLIENRRKYKNATDEQGKAEYRRLRNLVNREARKAKERYLERICKEVEENMQIERTDKAYRTANKFFNKHKKTTSGTIEDKEGRLLFGEDVGKRWKEYIEELYDGTPLLKETIGKEEETNEDDMGDYILQEEFEKAIKELANNKAMGIDDIPAELIKNAGENMKQILLKLIRSIYDTGELPTDFQKCIMVPIPKKKSAIKCEQYRTLSLVSHASKILLKIVQRRIEGKVEDMLSDQFGFRRGSGTREAILGLYDFSLKNKPGRTNQPILHLST